MPPFLKYFIRKILYIPVSLIIITMDLYYARDYLVGVGSNFVAHWWVYLPITLALILFSVGWNLIGDGLNDLLNPRE